MKMNRLLLVALIATGVFTSCTNDVVEHTMKEKAEVSFRLQGGMPDITTRSLATTINTINAFVVFGTDNVLGVSNDLIFDGVTVAREFGTSNFTYTPKRYYSDGATSAIFFALSPVSASVTNHDVSSMMSGASFDYTVPKPNDTGDAVQEDFLIAEAVVIPSTTPVSLEFKHALSRIFVTATNSTDDPVIINELILSNLYSSGTMVMDNTGNWSWNNHNDLTDYEYVLAPSGVVVPGNTTTKTLVTSMEQGMMVLPQVTQNTNNDDIQDTNDFALVVNYHFANIGAHTKNILIGDLFEFEYNKQYVINIDFKGQAIEFTITVTHFDDPVEVTYP